MSDVKIIVPIGMFGPGKDYLIDAIIRAIADSHAEEGEWADKYGVNFENDVFMMHRYCWCEQDGCLWCDRHEPNFLYKPTNFKVHWYKYIGRSMEFNRNISTEECAEILSSCIRRKKNG